MAMTDREHWNATKNYTNPKIRWFNGHYITALELKNQVIE